MFFTIADVIFFFQSSAAWLGPTVSVKDPVAVGCVLLRVGPVAEPDLRCLDLRPLISVEVTLHSPWSTEERRKIVVI